MRSSRQRFDAFRREYREKGEDAAQQGGSTEDESQRAGAKPAEISAEARAEKKARRQKYWRDYRAWLWPFRWQIAAVFASALGSALLSLIMPWATMHIIDVLLPARDFGMLAWTGAALLGVTVIQQLLDITRNWRMAKLTARVVYRIRERLYKHMLRLPLHELSDMKTGGITSRLSGDVDSTTGLMQMAIISPGVAGVKIALTLTMLLWINWRLAVAAAAILPFVILLNMAYIKRIRPIYSSMRRDRSDIDARAVETFGGIRVVRAFRREAAETRRYATAHHTIIRKSMLARLFESTVWAGWGFMLPMSALLIIWFGGLLVLRGQATIGGIMAFQMYVLMLLNPVSSIVQAYGETQQAMAAMERVFDLMQKPTDKPDRKGAAEAPRRVQSIEFDAVDFWYREGMPVLCDFTLRVEGGWTVALVGPSGSGKTTVTNLVARFYDPQTGAIRLNGVDLRDIKLRSYRRLLGLVQQEVFLFDGTIAENIAYGRRDAAREQVEHAARRANAHDFILSFPRGYDTIVGERGVRLSGGQAQRISIARALLADPQILILDEATSNLDTESEQLIQTALRELIADRTTFIIAHRLSTVMHADLIVVIENGRISETGTHAELMAADSRYRAMVQRQARGMAQAAETGENWLVS